MAERVYRIVIGDLPPAAERRELLELVLAAASLDLTVQVLLLGAAADLLNLDEQEGWQQLLDHGLAEVRLAPSEEAAAMLPGAGHSPPAGPAPAWAQADIIVRV